MTLLLVFVEDGFHFLKKRFVCLFKLCRDILMNGAFAYSELLRGRSYCRVIFNNIFSEYYASFLITVAGRSQRSFPPHVNYS